MIALVLDDLPLVNPPTPQNKSITSASILCSPFSILNAIHSPYAVANIFSICNLLTTILGGF